MIQLYWYIHIYPPFFRFFSPIGHYRVLSRVPCAIQQRSPTPGPLTSTGPRPARNRAHSRRWAAGEQAKLHLPLPIARITPWTIPPPFTPTSPVCGKIVFHKTSPWCQKGWGPLLYSRSLLVTYFIYSSVYMSIPIFQFIPPSSLPPSNHKIVFYICNSISVL